LTGGLRWLGRFATARSRIIPAVFVLLAAAAIPGLLQIEINDNPVNWFKSGSEIRVAVEELNELFPGTFNATWLLEGNEPGALTDPEVVRTVAALQQFWQEIGVIGQTTSYVDLVPRDGPEAVLPDSREDIELALDEAANSPQGNFVGGLITPDRQKAAVQVLLKDGDNQAMQRVVDRTDSFLESSPLPVGTRAEWAGETYLNLVWQDKMVSGMMKAFGSTFVVILVLALLLFRSLRWAILAVLPLTVTILLLYGGVGFIGRDYDMPLAVLSTLALGIAVDFAIHFIQRYRELLRETKASGKALIGVFEEPARAISRNALIIAAGFIPMFFTSLVPYIVVGALMAIIMISSWLVSLVLLPALIALFQRKSEAAASEA
jgi:predicted RND superfamily exporter protein